MNKINTLFFDEDLHNYRWAINDKKTLDLKTQFRGVYVLLDKEYPENGEGTFYIVYIGSSLNIATRIKQHIDIKEKYFSHFMFISMENLQSNQILKEESKLIQKYLPKYNLNIPDSEDIVTVNKYMFDTKNHKKDFPKQNYDDSNARITGFILNGKVYISEFINVEISI